MRAVVVTAYGGPEVLELRDVPEPRPAAGQVLVEVKVAGVNFRDLHERRAPGHGFFGEPPFVAGIEGVGRVLEPGEGVAGLRPGARVGWWLGPGSYAERTLVAADHLFPIPDDLADDVACACCTQGLTAHALAFSAAPLERGSWALVHAAAGGVGLILVQLLALRGVRVLATTSSAEKAALVREAGAEVVVGYADAAAHALELTDGVGVEAVFDAVGRDTFDASLATLRTRGTLVAYGAASGDVPPFELRRLASKSAHVTWARLPDYTATHAELLRRSGEVLGLAVEGKLRLHVGATYPLEEARLAQEALEQRRSTGKLVLAVA